MPKIENALGSIFAKEDMAIGVSSISRSADKIICAVRIGDIRYGNGLGICWDHRLLIREIFRQRFQHDLLVINVGASAIAA